MVAVLDALLNTGVMSGLPMLQTLDLKTKDLCNPGIYDMVRLGLGPSPVM